MVHVERHDKTLKIEWKWGGNGGYVGLMLGLLTIPLFWWASVQPNVNVDSKSLTQVLTMFIPLTCIFTIPVFLGALTALLNRTVIHADNERFIVRVGPFPWVRPKIVSSKGIQQFFATSVGSGSAEYAGLYLLDEHSHYIRLSTYFLPKGSTVLVNIQAVHMNPTLWPEPHQYNPYRFLTLSPSGVMDQENKPLANRSNNAKNPTSFSHKELEPYTFLPFIAGPRNCLGQHLALLETKMVIALLLQRYDISLPSDVSSSTDPRHPYMVPIIPKQEIMVTVSRRSDK